MVADNGDTEEWIHLHFTWAGKPFEIDVAGSDRCREALLHASIIFSQFCRVFDLKATLYSLTNVPPERQKILGLVKGKLPPDGEAV